MINRSPIVQAAYEAAIDLFKTQSLVRRSDVYRYLLGQVKRKKWNQHTRLWIRGVINNALDQCVAETVCTPGTVVQVSVIPRGQVKFWTTLGRCQKDPNIVTRRKAAREHFRSLQFPPGVLLRGTITV